MSNQLLKEYKNKLKLLESYNKHYYQNQKPLVTDKEYDDLKKNILDFEKKNNLKDPKSPSFKVGYKPSKNLKNINIGLKCCHYQMPLMKKI